MVKLRFTRLNYFTKWQICVSHSYDYGPKAQALYFCAYIEFLIR